MKYLIITISILTLFSCNTDEDNHLLIFRNGGVEQMASPKGDNKEENKVLCGYPVCIETYVWYNKDIVFSAYDNPDSLQSIKMHKIKADSLYNHIKKY